MTEKKSVTFSLTESEHGFFKEYAKRKGSTISALAKIALFQYEGRHRVKGLFIENHQEEPPF